jgi:hypothetical protein
MHPHQSRRLLLAAVLALSLLSAVSGQAIADTGDPELGNGLQKLLKYVSCAFATFVATTPDRMGQALLGCGMLYLEEVS